MAAGPDSAIQASPPARPSQAALVMCLHGPVRAVQGGDRAGPAVLYEARVDSRYLGEAADGDGVVIDLEGEGMPLSLTTIRFTRPVLPLR